LVSRLHQQAISTYLERALNSMDATEQMLLTPRVFRKPPVIRHDWLLILHGMLLHFSLRGGRGVVVHGLLV